MPSRLEEGLNALLAKSASNEAMEWNKGAIMKFEGHLELCRNHSAPWTRDMYALLGCFKLKDRTAQIARSSCTLVKLNTILSKAHGRGAIDIGESERRYMPKSRRLLTRPPQAQSHARKASRAKTPTAAVEEHELAAGQFASAAQGTKSSEASKSTDSIPSWSAH